MEVVSPFSCQRTTPKMGSSAFFDSSSLPCVPTDGISSGERRITPSTLVTALQGGYGKQTFQIIDCRFDYEYAGGHIRNALNFSDHKQLELYLFDAARLEAAYRERPMLIFYCEFGEKRSPTLAGYARSADRIRHLNEYPKLAYNEIFVVDGGYAAAHEHVPQHCTPSGYVRMKEEDCDAARWLCSAVTAATDDAIGFRAKRSALAAARVNQCTPGSPTYSTRFKRIKSSFN